MQSNPKNLFQFSCYSNIFMAENTIEKLPFKWGKKGKEREREREKKLPSFSSFTVSVPSPERGPAFRWQISGSVSVFASWHWHFPKASSWDFVEDGSVWVCCYFLKNWYHSCILGRIAPGMMLCFLHHIEKDITCIYFILIWFWYMPGLSTILAINKYFVLITQWELGIAVYFVGGGGD